MDKIWLILKREYTTRVFKKSFLLVTLLAPLGIALIAVAAGFLAASDSSTSKIAVVDNTGIFSTDKFPKAKTTYTVVPESLEAMKQTYTAKGYDILVNIPKLDSLDITKMSVQYYSGEKLSIANISDIEDNIEDVIKDYKIEKSVFGKEAIDKLKMKIDLENGLGSDGISGGEDKGIVGDKSSKLSSVIATGLSYMMGFLMYMVIFLFGSMVMRSVMEEKINRIIEVMISSVKPFQLLLGKVLGVGLVGLTQLGIWMILIPVVLIGVSAIFPEITGGAASAQSAAQAAEMMEQMKDTTDFNVANVIMEIKAMNWWLILPSFIVFFFGGYFLYSSLFAAVGASVSDDLAEGQQLMLPITIPVILALVMIPAVFNNPNGNIAIFGSMFPLFSPILMPARLPFDPPIWQVLLSIFFLICGVLFFTWIAARIYRVGILMYGKKVTFKELGKWIFYKG